MFSSGDISVADVDFNGKITARGAGTTTITATTNYFNTATCQVTVNPMLATTINLNQSAMNLTVGSSQKLTATVLPAGASDKSPGRAVTRVWQGCRWHGLCPRHG